MPNPQDRRPPTLRSAAGALAAAALLAACAAPPPAPEDFGLDKAVQETAPLGGESLALRKREMKRAHRDMGHFVATVETLHERRDRAGLNLFSGFLDSYMGEHLEPMLRSAWQSNHPELMALDAGLRLAKAEVLIQMRETRRVQQVLDEVEARYAGREAMLVEYPIGGQTTLGQAIEILRARKWRG